VDGEDRALLSELLGDDCLETIELFVANASAEQIGRAAGFKQKKPCLRLSASVQSSIGTLVGPAD
jgi:hypothetical protein